MSDIYIRLLLGNFIGDYFFQSRNMAKLKSRPGIKGTLVCALHCVIYTLVVATFCQNFRPLFLLFVFLSHYPIDRYSLAGIWLKLLNRGNFPKGNEMIEKHQVIETLFCGIMYAVVDNTAHLYLLWLIVKNLC